MNLTATRKEIEIHEALQKLKMKSGSHSPSIQTLKSLSSDLQIKVDACFLSNPYATDLFLAHLKHDILDNNKLRDYLEYYPSQNAEIAKKISPVIGVDHENILVGNGASELIQTICNHLVIRNFHIYLPTFSSYYEFVDKSVKREFYTLEETNRFEINVDEYIEDIKRVKPHTLLLINPNNPTGSYISKSDVKKIIEECDFCENIILDESFIHFAYEDSSLDLVNYYDWVNHYRNLIIIKSMSKDFGIAGIRVGYAVMDKAKVNNFLENGYLWNSNGLAEYFLNLYGSQGFLDKYEKVRKEYINETKKFLEDLKTIKNMNTFPSKANFVLAKIPPEIDCDLLCSLLLIRYGLYTRNCNDKIGLKGQYIRIASRSSSENILIKECFNEALG